MASRPKIIELTLAVAAPSPTARMASAATDSASGIRNRTMPAPPSAATRTGRKPIRSPITPPSGETSAPTRAAVPATSPIAEARPGPRPVIPSTSTGMYGRLIWIARKEMPKIRKIRRVAAIGQDAAQAGVGEIDDPAGRHDLRADLLRPERDQRRGPDRQQRREREDRRQLPAEAVDEDAGEGRPDREPDRTGRPEHRDRRSDPAERRDVADPRQHDPGVAQLEPDEQHRNGELPRLPGEGDRREDDRLDQRAADDHDLAAVLVGPGAPQRDERHPDDEDQGAEDADERESILWGDAHLAQVGREEGEDLADPEALDHRGDPEDREQDPPVLGGARFRVRRARARR